jgi:hypothetical protein
MRPLVYVPLPASDVYGPTLKSPWQALQLSNVVLRVEYTGYASLLTAHIRKADRTTRQRDTPVILFSVILFSIDSPSFSISYLFRILLCRPQRYRSPGCRRASLLIPSFHRENFLPRQKPKRKCYFIYLSGKLCPPLPNDEHLANLINKKCAIQTYCPLNTFFTQHLLPMK